MEIPQREAFVAVGTFGGFRRAADALRVSQPAVSARIKALEESLGVALFERAVGYYASLVHINASHQPGVEAGKKAAGALLALQARVVAYLVEKKGHALTAAQIASGMGAHHEDEAVFKICEHLAANPGRGVTKTGSGPTGAAFAAA